ncbi:MAG: acetyl-CoA acetyltransferase [Planctomycetes bacterium RBG_16_59_8]|nr:MAG: acetyl-CoA acetyltransferase [Planctomycetes bacterium RBG_16_59_8]
MIESFIVSAARTPIGKFFGSLSALTAPQLGALAVREAVRRSGIAPDKVDEVIMGCVLQAGLGQNPARQAAIRGGVAPSAGAFTVNKVCGSGLKAVALACQAIACGDAQIVVAGGMESMTNAPHLIPDLRKGSRLGHGKLVDVTICDGLWDVYEDFHMGITCELVAEKYGISREEMDEYAVNSHRKASAAIQAGKFKSEIVPVEVKDEKGNPTLFTQDEGPRADASLEKLAKLKPAFKKEGRVTPGNASTINDGACALVVMSGAKLRELGVAPIARITGYATGGVEPKWVMMAPLEAVANLEKKCGVDRKSFDLFEINEAFAGASCAVVKELKVDPARVNVHGGAVALGHPIGASGARILTTLLSALKDRNLKKGLATLCLGGGNAVALSVELT